MKITLTPRQEKFVRTKVKSGSYRDVSDVIREAVRLLEKLDKTESSDLEALIAEADNEESEPMTGDDWKQIRRRVFAKQRKAAA